MRRASQPFLSRGLPIPLAVALFVGCIQPATQMLVIVSTDVPTEVPLSIRVTIRAGSVTISDAAADVRWMRGAGDGSVQLPATFGVVPGPGARDAQATLLVEGVGPDFVLRRIVRFRFRPHMRDVIHVLLTQRCQRAASGCAASILPCTQQRLCEERDETCGDDGSCISTTYVPVSDAGSLDTGPMDARADAAVPDIAGDRAPIDSTVSDDGVSDVTNDGNADVPCGNSGQMCCSGSRCAASLVCSGSVCMACGGRDQPCCPGNSCSTGLSCGTTGRCECGGQDQPCCPMSTCTGSFLCTAGICRVCGENGAPCCAGGLCPGSAVLFCELARCTCVLIGGACSMTRSCCRGARCPGSGRCCLSATDTCTSAGECCSAMCVMGRCV